MMASTVCFGLNLILFLNFFKPVLFLFLFVSNYEKYETKTAKNKQTGLKNFKSKVTLNRTQIIWLAL